MNLRDLLSNTRNIILDNIESSLVGNKNVLGIDIGQSSIKIAEVGMSQDRKKAQLLKYAEHSLSEGTIIEDEVQNEEELVNAIKEAVKKGEFSTKYAALGLFGPQTMAKKLKLAGGDPEEIENQVFWESEQYIPFDLEDAYLSYHIMRENTGGGIDVIVAAATRDFVENFKSILSKADLRTKIVDISQLAILNVFEFVYASKFSDTSHSNLILNIGGQSTDFIIHSEGGLSFSKDIHSGGLAITEEIQRQMGVTYTEAEDLKTRSDENGNLPEEILGIVDDMLATFLSEIKKSVNFYKDSTLDESLNICYVTGGGAQIPGILEKLEELLKFKVTVLDPFDAVSVDRSKYSEDELRSISFRSVSSIGLAMRQMK